jgi:hypothetical protein
MRIAAVGYGSTAAVLKTLAAFDDEAPAVRPRGE